MSRLLDETSWVRSEAFTGALRAEYEHFVRTAAGGHYTQMPAWDEVERSVRPMATRYFLVRRAGRLVGAARVARTAAFGIPLPIASVERGPVVAEPAELEMVLRALARAASHHGIARLNVMPYWAGGDVTVATRALAATGWSDAQRADGAHARTLRLALDGDPFAGKEREALRRKLRLAEKAGATARQAAEDGIDPLHGLHEALMTSQGRPGRPRQYFRALYRAAVASNDGAFFVTEHERKPVAALFVAHHGSVATFVLGASTRSEKSFSKMAPAMAAAMRLAKGRGARVFDLGGIPLPEDDDPKRASIAQFKLDFAKQPVPLTREHARPLLPGLA